jgi:hypothetical protein
VEVVYVASSKLWGRTMMANDRELQTTLERIAWFQQQVAHLRRTEVNPVNYSAAASGFLAEIDRMQLEVREYFCFLPAESGGGAAPVAAAVSGGVATVL